VSDADAGGECAAIGQRQLGVGSLRVCLRLGGCGVTGSAFCDGHIGFLVCCGISDPSYEPSSELIKECYMI